MASENPLPHGKTLVQTMVATRVKNEEENTGLFSFFFAANIAVEILLVSLLVYMTKKRLIDVVIVTGIVTTMIILFIGIVMSYRAIKRSREAMHS
jgi:hypothetical protein